MMVTPVARQQSSRLSPSPLHPERDATCPLDQAAEFLLSIPAEEAVLLKQTREFHSFLRSLERLKQAHQRITPAPSPQQHQQDASCMFPNDHGSTTSAADEWIPHLTPEDSNTSTSSGMIVETAPFDEKSFLQTDASDDVLHRIMDYLESCDLVRAGTTCRRYHHLIHRHVERKCPAKMRQRQLSNTMQLLRCAEQMDGVAAQQPSGAAAVVPHVPFPLLLPNRRIVVTECGDFEYNGVYFCTGCNGNGFVFTKPRSPRRRVPDGGVRHDDDDARHHQPGELLRCVIAKRFSEAVRMYGIV